MEVKGKIISKVEMHMDQSIMSVRQLALVSEVAKETIMRVRGDKIDRCLTQDTAKTCGAFRGVRKRLI